MRWEVGETCIIMGGTENGTVDRNIWYIILFRGFGCILGKIEACAWYVRYVIWFLGYRIYC